MMDDVFSTQVDALRVSLHEETARRERAELERDRANQAYETLYTSHRALAAARDANATQVRELRERLFAAERLVATWRAETFDLSDNPTESTLKTCADELEAALRG